MTYSFKALYRFERDGTPIFCGWYPANDETLRVTWGLRGWFHGGLR